MRVLHLSQTYFGEQSFMGGGERYAYELARAVAKKEEVVFLSFADKGASYRDDRLQVEHIQRNRLLRRYPLFGNPASLVYVKWLRWAEVIHCHQIHRISTDLAIVLGRLSGKKIFATDLGGGHRYAPSCYLPLLKWTDGFLLISEYSRKLWEGCSLTERPQQLQVIYGGVDTEKFSPGPGRKSNAVLFVGRLLPHKGIDYLIDAIGEGMSLDIVGRIYRLDYFDRLKAKSENKPITFHPAASDDSLVHKYREALVTVLPSVYENCYGERTLVPELLGLVALESMACGTPVILTDVGSLPEIVEDGVTGFLVPPNDPAAIRAKLEYLIAHPAAATKMGKRGREAVLKRFTWDAVAERCLASYRLSIEERVSQ